MINEKFGILFVCTGNICRSSTAEIVTRSLLVYRLGASATAFAVDSAGTAAIPGARMATGSLTALCDLGARRAAWSFQARELDAGMVVAADLVLAAERCHRQQIVTLEPSALGKTFCLREFVRLLDGVDRHDLPVDPVLHACAAVALARRRRGMTGRVREADDALQDPVAHTLSAHQQSVATIAAISRQLVEVLTPPPQRSKTDVLAEGAATV